MNLRDYPLTKKDLKRGLEGEKNLKGMRERVKKGKPTARDLTLQKYIERSDNAIKRGVLTSEM